MFVLDELKGLGSVPGPFAFLLKHKLLLQDTTKRFLYSLEHAGEAEIRRVGAVGCGYGVAAEEAGAVDEVKVPIRLHPFADYLPRRGLLGSLKRFP